MGLVVVFLVVHVEGWDLMADPVGWALVLLGLGGLVDRVPELRPARTAAVVALLVSALTCVPVSELGRALRTDESLGWMASLPALAFGYLVADALRSRLPAPWPSRFGLLRWGFVVAAALPVLIFGAGWEVLVPVAALLIVIVDVLLVIWTWSASRTDPVDPLT